MCFISESQKAKTGIREIHGNIPSNKTLALTKSMIMDIWVVSTLNQLFIWGCHSQDKFSKK